MKGMESMIGVRNSDLGGDGKSGRGPCRTGHMPHSKTLARMPEGLGPAPAFGLRRRSLRSRRFRIRKPAQSGDFADSSPHSKTLARPTGSLRIPPGFVTTHRDGAFVA